MKRIAPALVSALVLVLGACTPVPIPTATFETPTAVRSPAPAPTASATPTATALATVEIASPPTITPAPILATTTTPVAYERIPRAILVEADVWGGAGAAPQDSHVPIFRLYGDGLVVSAGARAPLSSGLDASVRVGHLSEGEIQTLLAYIGATGFFSLKDSYQPRPVPPDQPTAHISVFSSKAKTVSVYAPDADSTPQAFIDVLNRLVQTLPADAQTFTPTDAYLESTDAGAASGFAAKDDLGDWSILGARLADATEGVTVSGSAFSQISVLIARQAQGPFFREGDRAYRVRFAPNLPRGVHLTDWLGAITDAPREFEGRSVDIVGYYRGANLFGEAPGSVPVSRSDWVIVDASGAMYVTGAAPPGLDLYARADAWSVVRLTARVVYVRLGTSYLEARRVQVLARSATVPSPTATITATVTLTSTRLTATATRTLSATQTLTATRTATAAP
ncbi:MAG: hypothetical protein KGJ80_00455 [Chloroflexota bacterium]|nr:hypothetical protein [Chloroflexota bacterium]